MNIKRLLATILSLCMVFVIAQVPVMATAEAEPGTGVRYNENGELLYKPEDVGQLENPAITTLVSPVPDDEWYAQEIGWKEEAYGIECITDTCAWSERETKWIAAYVSGRPYDVLTRVNFPTVVIKGLLQPLDDILPVDDERYFKKEYSWQGNTFGVRTISQNYTYRDAGEMYGVWYNKDLFEDNALETPLELMERDAWTIEALIDLAEQLTLDTDRDGINDIGGFGTHKWDMFTIGNGAQIVTFDDDGVDLTWADPAYVKGLEYIAEISPYKATGQSFAKGTLAMYGERIQCHRQYSETSPEHAIDFDAVWVPFPKGPDGYGVSGSISTGAEITCIGNGAKNIEGAKVWICADICKFDYVSPEGATMMIGVEQDTLDMALAVEEYVIKDYYASIGTMSTIMQRVWSEAVTLGAKATIEKYTFTMEEQLETLLAIESVGHYHTYDNECDSYCEGCGETRTPSHRYYGASDTECKLCGYTRVVFNENSPIFVAENKTAKVGTTFTVEVSVNKNPGITSLKLMAGYDSNILELVSIEEKDFDGTTFGPLTKNPITMLWEDVLSPNNTSNGTVAVLTFKVKETATACDTAITLTYDPDDVYDENFDNVTFAVESGVVTVTEYIPGDINADNEVNNKDFGLLRQYLTEWDVTVDLRAAEVTGDGKVNNKDLGILRQYLNGWDVELK